VEEKVLAEIVKEIQFPRLLREQAEDTCVKEIIKMKSSYRDNKKFRTGYDKINWIEEPVIYTLLQGSTRSVVDSSTLEIAIEHTPEVTFTLPSIDEQVEKIKRACKNVKSGSQGGRTSRKQTTIDGLMGSKRRRPGISRDI
jgi:hypothetical protein